MKTNFFQSELSVSVFLGIEIGHRNRYRNRYSPLTTVFFGYRFGSEFTEFKIWNLPKLFTSPAQVPKSQLMAWSSRQQPTTGNPSPVGPSHIPPPTRVNNSRRPHPGIVAQAHRTQPPVATAHCSVLHVVPPNSHK
jgi:hypothetical protein